MVRTKTRRFAALMALVACAALPALGQAVTSIQRDAVGIEAGSAEGVKVGMTGTLLGTVPVDGTPKEMPVATVKVTQVQEHTCTAVFIGRFDLPGEKGAPIKGAFRVVFEKAEAETTAPPAEAVPSAEKSPLPTGAFRDERDGLDFVRIPPGTFTMGVVAGDPAGDTDEKPAHAVTLTREFWLSRTEVTVAAYKAYCKATGKAMPPSTPLNADWARDDYPMLNVTWDEARAFCVWAGGRLPTEAEWEYAARAGTKTIYYWGDAMDGAYAWYSVNGQFQPHATGQKLPNAFGLYDMLGNGWEWCADWFATGYYAQSPARDPAGPATGEFKVLRGGSFKFNPAWLRASYRLYRPPNFRNVEYVFRCARDKAP